jgi:predicted  nucleic acid-binding Zn-ribbon protein
LSRAVEERVPALAGRDALVHLGDLDLLLAELQEPASRTRLKKIGLGAERLERLETARQRTAAAVDRRWTVAYERARQRYGRGIAAVRDRVCLGCFVTLPTTARPRPGEPEAPTICESCGRILYWR